MLSREQSVGLESGGQRGWRRWGGGEAGGVAGELGGGLL